MDLSGSIGSCRIGRGYSNLSSSSGGGSGSSSSSRFQSRESPRRHMILQHNVHKAQQARHQDKRRTTRHARPRPTSRDSSEGTRARHALPGPVTPHVLAPAAAVAITVGCALARSRRRPWQTRGENEGDWTAAATKSAVAAAGQVEAASCSGIVVIVVFVVTTGCHTV